MKNTITHQLQIPPDSLEMETFQGAWTYDAAAHLLRRCLFGVSHEQILYSLELGLEKTMDLLFDDLPSPDPPLNHRFEDDPDVPVGQTWVFAGVPQNQDVARYRQISLRAWIMGLMMGKEMSIREKLVLFWHNHFVVAEINDARYLYKYSDTLRRNAWGNFKELTKEMTVDPAMLRFLNGNQNSFEAPNENYSRELLELFTVGKGGLAGPGDYSTFTEQDVAEMARVLTGWRDYGYRRDVNADPNIGAVFIPRNHDVGLKILSHRFENTWIDNGNENEYAQLIEVIFQSDHVALHICRKLYRWFVYYDIGEETEAEVIVPMAQMLEDNNFEIAEPLRMLLSSNHFFDEERRGCMIKNPIDFVIGIFNQFDMGIGDLDDERRERLNMVLFDFTALLQMEYFGHPTVAGWKAYYQEPAFYQSWINSVTLPLRSYITDLLALNGAAYGDRRLIIDIFGLLDSLENAYDVNEMIEDLGNLLFPLPLSELQMASLKEVLIPGLPDFEWTIEYSQYKSDPQDEEVKRSVEQKLRAMLVYILRSPEYQLS